MELMVTLALAGVLFGIGVPAFRNYTQNARLTGAANEMLTTVIAARNEAVRRQTTVSMCPSTTPDSSSATCTSSATQGWIAFVDTNNDCSRSGTEELVANFLVHDQVNATKNGTCVKFGANGFRQVVAGQPSALHALFCDSRGLAKVGPTSTDSVGRGVEILATGRPSTSRLYAELTGWNSGSNAVTCP